VYNQTDPLLPDLIVCTTPLAPAILDAVRTTGETPRTGETQ
jgi:hypothetical protein